MQHMKTTARNLESNTTRQKLILTGIRLFSRYGFDATTTRMIAKEAEVSLSSISFYFESKEALYSSCLEFIARKSTAYYEGGFKKAKALLDRGKVTKEEAYEAISLLLNLQIKTVFGRQYASSLKLIYWEQVLQSESYHPITNAIFESVEKMIAELIAAATPTPYKDAIIASRFINGSIIAFGEHSLLVQYALLDAKSVNDKPEKWTHDQIVHYSDIFVRDILGMPQEGKKS